MASDLAEFVHARLAEDAERARTLHALREVEAKRAILAEHKPYEIVDGYPVCGRCMRLDDRWRFLPAPCPTLRHLAAVWSDHPDFQPEWVGG